jgi:hypothetical protein
MPITFSCPCGKTLKVKDDLAGERIKCPACGEVQAVPAAADDWEVVEDDAPEGPAAAAEGERKTPVKRKKKKTNRPPRLRDREAEDEDWDQYLQRSYWRKRLFRGTAFMVLGAIIIAGGIYILVNYRKEDFNPLYSWGIVVCGAAAVIKGFIGLFLGRFFG